MLVPLMSNYIEASLAFLPLGLPAHSQALDVVPQDWAPVGDMVDCLKKVVDELGKLDCWRFLQDQAALGR